MLDEMSLEDKKRWLEQQKQEELSDLPVAMAVPSNEYNDLPVVAALPTEETTPPVLGEERTPSSSLTSQKAKDFVKKIKEPQSIEQPSRPTLSETKPRYDVKQAFEDAQTASTLQSMMGRLGKAGAQIGAGIAGGTGPGVASVAPKVDTSISDELIKDSDSHLKRFAIEKQLQEEAEQKDPNSPYSRMMKDFLFKHGIVKDPKILDNLPGHELDRIFGQFVKVKGIEDAAASRRIAQAGVQAQREALQDYRTQRMENQEKERTNKQIDTFVKYIDPTQKAGGSYSGYQKVIDSAKRVEPLLYNPDGSFANPNKSMMEEIGIAVNTLIAGSGGSRARAQIEALLPDTFKGRLNDFLQFIRNEPTGRDQQAFVEQFAKLVKREKGVASKQILDEIDKRAKSLRPRIRDKETFDDAVELRKKDYEVESPNEIKKTSVNLPKDHGMTPGTRFKAKGKMYMVNKDSSTATEL